MCIIVTCPICLREFKSLSSHVLRIHHMSISDFRTQYPNCQMVADSVKEKISKTSKVSGCGKWRKGTHLSDEHKEKISKHNMGEGNPFFGKKHSVKTREQMSHNHADITGDNNPFRKAMKSEESRASFKKKMDEYFQGLRDDPEKWKAYCEMRSISSTNAHIQGKIPAYGRGHKHGRYESSKSEVELMYQSSYELKFLQLLDKCDHFKKVSRSDFSILYTDDQGKQRRYTPDFIVDDNIVVELKAKFAMTLPDVICKLNAGKLYCDEYNMCYVCITDVDKQFPEFVKKFSKDNE